MAIFCIRGYLFPCSFYPCSQEFYRNNLKQIWTKSYFITWRLRKMTEILLSNVFIVSDCVYLFDCHTDVFFNVLTNYSDREFRLSYRSFSIKDIKMSYTKVWNHPQQKTNHSHPQTSPTTQKLLKKFFVCIYFTSHYTDYFLIRLVVCFYEH